MFLVLAATARGDSVLRSDNVTFFGIVASMTEKEVVLTATFPLPTGVKEVRIPRDKIVKIEFNRATFNPPGSPGIGALPVDGSKTLPPQPGEEYAVLSGGQHQSCVGATIDSQHNLHCGNDEFARSRVIRIFLARK